MRKSLLHGRINGPWRLGEKQPRQGDGCGVKRFCLARGHPLTNPNNLARAVAPGVPGVSLTRFLRAGYEQAVTEHWETSRNLGRAGRQRRHLRPLQATHADDIRRARSDSPHMRGPRPSPEALNAAGYEKQDSKLVYVPGLQGYV
jgi:hypothetical protein